MTADPSPGQNSPYGSPQLPGTLCRETLDALSSHIAVVDNQGTILFINRAWQNFARENDDPTLDRSAVGGNCFAVCRSAADAGSADARLALEGMVAVLNGDLPQFEMEYPCDAPVTGEERWFTLRVTPLRDAGLCDIVTSHTNITRLKQLEALSAREQVSRDRSERQASEIGSMEALYRSPGTSLTAGSYGAAPLSRSLPTAFAELVDQYAAVLDQAVEERGYKVKHGIEAKLREMAQALAFYKCGPRDVIEIHGAALKRTALEVPGPRTQAYLEEGRIAVLETMGYLVSRYRNEALGMAGLQGRMTTEGRTSHE